MSISWLRKHGISTEGRRRRSVGGRRSVTKPKKPFNFFDLSSTRTGKVRTKRHRNRQGK